MASFAREFQNLQIFLWPSDEFGAEELPSGEIPAFVKKYGLSTDGEERCTIMEKAKTNGAGAHPVWKLVKQANPGEVEWNFAAWCVFDGEGKLVGRFGMRELSRKVVESAIRALN